MLTVGEVMSSQKKLIQRANEVLSGVPPGQMRILLRKSRWNVESLLETFAEKGEKARPSLHPWPLFLTVHWQAIFESAGLIPPSEAKKMPTTGKGACLTCMEEYPYKEVRSPRHVFVLCLSELCRWRASPAVTYSARLAGRTI